MGWESRPVIAGGDTLDDEVGDDPRLADPERLLRWAEPSTPKSNPFDCVGDPDEDELEERACLSKGDRRPPKGPLDILGGLREFERSLEFIIAPAGQLDAASLPRGEAEEGESVASDGHTESKGCSGSGPTGIGRWPARGLEGRGAGDEGRLGETMLPLLPLPEPPELGLLPRFVPKACRRGDSGMP